MSDRQMDPHEVAAQIGLANMMAISGLRINTDKAAPGHYPDLLLPVSSGYRVRISLDSDDTYTVTREMKRGDKVWVKGTQEGVYCDEIGDVAYYASCYKNVDFGDHKVRA